MALLTRLYENKSEDFVGYFFLTKEWIDFHKKQKPVGAVSFRLQGLIYYSIHHILVSGATDGLLYISLLRT